MSDFENELRELLRREENRLDPADRGLLQTARVTALQQRPSRLPRYAVPALLGMALASLVGLVLLLPEQFNVMSGFSNRDDSRLADNPDLYRDLDFYLWLSESDPGGRG